MNTLQIIQLVLEALNSPAGQEVEQELLLLLNKFGKVGRLPAPAPTKEPNAPIS